ncbi:MAG: hypothetical protein ACYSUY_14195 [Planctomycetota bacterium]|jgi:hypothetical protein
MLQDIRTSPRERQVKAVLSKSKIYATSIALLPVLQKSGIGTWRIETPDLAPEFSFFTQQINIAGRARRSGILGFISLVKHGLFVLLPFFNFLRLLQ